MYRCLVVAGLCLLGCGLTSGQCGEKPPQAPWEELEQRIVGGRPVADGAWPWQAAVTFNGSGTFRHTCGGILIDDWWILTAAHCVEANMPFNPDPRREDPEYFQIVLGANNQTDTSEAGVQYLDIDFITKHDRWIPDVTQGNPSDIALLRLTEPADIANPNIGLGCIPQQHDMDFVDHECWISGWGKINWTEPWIPEDMREAQVHLLSNENCSSIHIGVIRDTHICAGIGYPNACSGDSGGPMTCLKDDTWYVTGITSWGIITCEGVPGVYTRTSKYWEWIELKKLANPPPELE